MYVYGRICPLCKGGAYKGAERGNAERWLQRHVCLGDALVPVEKYLAISKHGKMRLLRQLKHHGIEIISIPITSSISGKAVSTRSPALREPFCQRPGVPLAPEPVFYRLYRLSPPDLRRGLGL